jgi:hypothetical protein
MVYETMATDRRKSNGPCPRSLFQHRLSVTNRRGEWTVPAPTLRSLEAISARWVELPGISYGRHPATPKKMGPRGYCLTEKIAAVLDEPHSADPVGVARTVCDYAFALGDLVTLPALVRRGDPLAAQRARLDAAGPRIAAACRPDADIERRWRVTSVGLTFRIAAGWLVIAAAVGATRGADKPGLAEHGAELAAIAEGEPLTSKEARMAASRAGEAAARAAWTAMSITGRAAKTAARQERAEDEVAWLERKAAASAACAASNQARWDAFQAFTPGDRVLWSAPYAAELAARKATTWPPVGATELPPAIQARIRSDADTLLDVLDAMIVLWENAESSPTSSGSK